MASLRRHSCILGVVLACAIGLTVAILNHAFRGESPAAGQSPSGSRNFLRDPEEFQKLPVNIRTSLMSSMCKIPVAPRVGASSVISGNFSGSESIDYAVLCSNGNDCWIRVFVDSNSGSMSVVDIGARNVSSCMQAGPSGEWVFSRSLAARGPTEAGKTRLEGVEDIFMGKASTIYYHMEGKWVEYPGSD